MLMLTNLAPEHAGDYAVLVQNDTASVTSQLAALVIASPTIRPSLALAGAGASGSLLRISGETGRALRIESSTNFTEWQAETLNIVPPTSIVLQTAAVVALPLATDAPHRFFRAGTYHPANEICNANLKRIRHAKYLWGRATQRPRYSTPMLTDLRPYYKEGLDPRCPVGFYSANSLDRPPRCSVSTHILEEPH